MAEGLPLAGRDLAGGEEEEEEEKEKGGLLLHMRGCRSQLSPQTTFPGWPTSCSTSLKIVVGMTSHIPAMVGGLGASTDPEIGPPLLPQGYSLLFPPYLSSPWFKKISLSFFLNSQT